MKYLSIIFVLFFAFSAFGQIADREGPRLVSLSFTPDKIYLAGSQEVTITAHITDDVSGFAYADIKFYGVSGIAIYYRLTADDRISGTALDGVYQATRRPSSLGFSSAGNYAIRQVVLYDVYGLHTNNDPRSSNLVVIACTYSLSTPSVNIPATGGFGYFTVATQNGCAFTAAPSNAFITIDGAATGTGTQNVNYFVEKSDGTPRTGTISVGGQTFTINQAAGKSRKRLRFSDTGQAVGMPLF